MAPPGGAAQWLAEARAGSPEALGRLLEACRGYLLVIARKELAPELQGKGSASDLVQETFVDAQRDFARFEGGSETELLAWLRRLLLNNIGNFTRRYRETSKRQVSGEVSLAEGSSAQLGDALVADTPTPSEQAIRQEKVEAVQQALTRLPEDYRQVLLLRYQDQLAFEEIAARMGRTSTAVRKLWSRAVERMHQELEPPHEPGTTANHR